MIRFVATGTEAPSWQIGVGGFVQPEGPQESLHCPEASDVAAQEDEGVEEDPDVKGGGQAAEDRRRTVKQVRGKPGLVSTSGSVAMMRVWCLNMTFVSDALSTWLLFMPQLRNRCVRVTRHGSRSNASSSLLYCTQELADDLGGAPSTPRPTSDQLPPIPIKARSCLANTTVVAEFVLIAQYHVITLIGRSGW